jgi:hypothetical protein
MRKIDLVVVHCSDSDVPAHDNIETVRKWHTLPKMPESVKKDIASGKLPKSETYKYGNGWSDIGYQYFIDKSGVVHRGRSEATVGAHVSGHNARSIGVCVSGRERFTDAQFRALKELLKDICTRHKLDIKTQVKGHRDLQPAKTCPNFEIKDVL